MGNTSTNNDKTAADEAKVKLIIGEIGRDTQTGIIGRGYSFDNGNTFHVTDTIYGRLYTQNDADGLWNNGLHEKVKEKVNQEITNTVEPAIKQADSAVAYANDAIEKSRVNSQAIVEINSAVSDAVSDAAVARSDGLRAWDAAQSNVDLIDSNYASASAAISSARTEAIAAADEAKASASAAQADIVAVRSDVAAVQADVTANKSDVAVAKSDIAVAKTSLASQATSLSSYAKQASAAGKDITVLKSQAGQFEQDMANTKGDVSQLKVSASSASVALSDAAGNISSLQATAKSYSAALSDTNSNVASVTATASDLEAKYADAAGDINQIKTDAKGTAETIADAQGDIASLKKRADGFDAQFTNAKSDIAVIQTDATGTKETLTNAKSDIAVLQSRADGFDTKFADTAGDINALQVDASGMKQTLTDAQGNISTLQATATGFKNTLTDAQGNISTLQSDVSGLKKTTSDHAGNIATLQSDAKTLTSQMSSAQGDISTLKQTASGMSSKVSGMETSLADANNRLDNLKIGTSNLLHHSDTFDGWVKGASVSVTADKYLGGSVAMFNSPGSGVNALNIDLDGPYDNQPVTWTVYAKADNAGDKLHTELWGGGGFTDQPLTNNWQIYQFTGQRNTNNHSFYLWGCEGNKGNIYVALPFAVVGNAIGTWEPNSTDIADKITTNTTAIEQNKKAITLKADQTVVDKTNGTVQRLQSQLKVQADQINAKVSSSDLDAKLNDLQIGGRNLFKDTDKMTNADYWGLRGAKLSKAWYGAVEEGIALSDNNLQCVSYNPYIDYIPQIAFEQGTDYTVSFWTTAVDAPRLFLNSNDGDNHQHNGLQQNISLQASGRTYNGNNWKQVTATFKPIVATAYLTFFVSTAWVSSFKLEKGNKTTPWSPAPEDAQTYTQTQIKQTADSWNANLTSVKNGLTEKYTNLHATVDGIQAQVYNSDGSSRITQLSNLIATKVSSGDYNSQITQLKNDINLRVAKGNVVSQINQEAGGNTLIQVANGMGKLALNASSVVFSGSAFIPDAYITTLNADKLRFYDSYGNVATMSANLVQHDDDKVARTINLQYNGGYEVHASNTLGSILTMHDDTIRLAVKSSGSSGDQYSGVYAMTHYTQLSNYRSDGSAPGVFIYDDQFNILGDANGAGTSKGDMHISSPQLYLNGSSKLQAGGDHALLTIASDYTTIHADKNVWMETGNTQLHLDNSNNLEIFNKNNTNTSNYDVHLTVRGWATFTGWVNCLGLTQTSRLSTKTNIERLDTARALELINSADVATYQYKQDVANGGTKRHASVIIDDVNDVARYQTPDEFISEDRSGRNDGDIVGYLMGAVQELTKKFKTLESKVG